jgi:hypothetical protein
VKQQDRGTKGSWLLLEEEEDLRDKIADEREHQSRSPSKKSTSLTASRTSTESLSPQMTKISALQQRIHRAEKNYANELLFIQAISHHSGPTERTQREYDEIENAAVMWLENFRDGQARFEAVCEKQGLFKSMTAEEEGWHAFAPPYVCSGEMEVRAAKKLLGTKKKAKVIDLMDSDIE